MIHKSDKKHLNPIIQVIDKNIKPYRFQEASPWYPIDYFHLYLNVQY